MNGDTRPIAYSYTRFSSPEQSKGISYKRQIEAAQKLAAEKGWRLAGVTFNDHGVSAYRRGNLKRGKLREFLSLVEDGRIAPGSILIIEAWDRFSRAAPMAALADLAAIVSKGLSVATTINGRVYDEPSLNGLGSLLEVAVLLSAAHDESDKKSSRHKANWDNKRSKAEGPTRTPMTATCPAWLALSDDRKSYTVIPERAKIVRRIFDDYLGGTGLNGIATRLNEEGVPPFNRAKLWYRSYIMKTIENRAVVGEFTPHLLTEDGDGRKVRHPLTPIPDYYPAIVTPEVFNRAAAMRSGRRAPSSGTAGRRISHMLAGLARCPKCGSSMLRVVKGPKGGHPKLVCYRAKNKAGCVARGVRVDTVEAAIFQHLEEFAVKGDPGTSAQWLDAIQRQKEDKARIEKRLERLLTMIAEGDEEGENTLGQLDAVMPMAAREVRKLERQRQEIEDWLQETDTKLSMFGPASVGSRLADLREEARRPEPDVVRINALLRQVLSRVVVNYERGEIAFHWHGTGVSRLPYDAL